MTEIDSKRASQLALAFSGKITASVTHEVNNVMAIVRELSGLIEDLLYGAQQTGQIDLEKLKTISEKITFQTQRGEAIIKRLNRFAHTADVPPRNLELRKLIQDIVELSQRFAVMKNVRLEANLPEDSTEVESNPFLLHNAVFLCIDMFMNSGEEGCAIVVSYRQENSGIKINVSGPQFEDNEVHTAEHAFLSYLMQELHGSVDIQYEQDQRQSYTLFVPMRFSNNIQ